MEKLKRYERRFKESKSQIETPEFKKWFGRSKVKKSGKPLIVYHGTQEEYNFTKFKDVSFFTNKSSYADQYAGKDIRYYPNRENPDGTLGTQEIIFSKYGRILPVYLKIQNPKYINKEDTKHNPKIEKEIIIQAKKNKHDGLFILYDGTDRVDYVVFYPNQIKSAIGNNGMFSSRSDNIYERVN